MEKNKQELLEKTFRQFLKTGFEGDNPLLMKKLVDERIMGFGTAIDEKVIGSEGLMRLIETQKKQAEGLDISWRYEPVDRFISDDENTAVFAEEIYFNINTGEEKLEMYLRFSIVLNYSKDQWKVIHWHGSKPEEVESEKDTWGIENWKQKAEELERLVAEKTVDLVEKNRELEIEAALERVRARALAMHSSEELPEVALELRKQMGLLGQEELEVCVIHLYEEDENYFESWGAMRAPGEEGKIFQGLAKFPNSGIAIVDEMIAHYRAGDKDYILVNEGEKAQEWFEVLKKYSPEIYQVLSKTIEQTPPDQLKAYWAMADFEGGSLGMVTYSLPDSDSLKLLRQSANVFQLAYRRYQDLQKAEEQARVAQVEAALERVRTQTMAMHNSEDVGQCILKMFSELTSLGVDEGTRFGIGILNHNNENNQLWTARRDGEEVKMHVGNLDMTSHPLLKKAREAWKKQIPFHKYVLEGADLLAYYQMLNQAPDYKIHIPLEKLPKKEIQHCFIFEHGFFYAFSPNEFKPELIQITQRFSSQFAQTYRRYLDLVKAEAQAREAQIEAALEKVRSRSLAMHRSDELKEIVKVLFERLNELQIPVTSVGISINIAGSKDLDNYTCGLVNSGIVINNYRLPYFDHRIANDFFEAREKQLDFFLGHYSKQEKDSFYEYVIENTELKNELADDIKQFIFQSPTYSIAVVTTPHTMMTLNDFEDKSLSDGEKDILKRFARVFEQTYTRFLDLQRAEAQAREAQIEAALERIRSKSLAMYKTDDLGEVVKVVFEQMQGLSVDMGFASVSIFIFQEGSRNIRQWIPISDGVSSLSIPYFDHPISSDLFDAKDNGADYFAKVYTLVEKNTWLKNGFEQTDYKHLPEEFKASLLNSPGYAMSIALAKNSGICIPSFEGKLPSSEDLEIMKRVGNVFEQAYIRFLDLQKAEEQTRIAEIELALERVRARTMAMHKSEELAETAAVLFEQLRILGNTPERINLGIFIEEENLIEWWITTQDGHLIEKSFKTKFEDHQVLRGMFKAWKEKKKSNVINLKGDEVKDWVQYITTVLGMPVNPELVKEQRFLSSAYFSQGLIGTTTSTPLPKETISLLERFASVFQQTYTRFLDLQKAEAQTRESQIQLALERVRARSMAMYHSDEITEVVKLLYKEFDSLNLSNESTDIEIGLIDEETGMAKVWAHLYLSDGSISTFNFPFTHFVETNNEFRIWQSTPKEKRLELFITSEYTGKNWNRFKNLAREIPELKEMFAPMFTPNIKKWVSHNAYFSHGLLTLQGTEHYSKETQEIQKRFAKVFEQTYTRFLDLKRAEEQAREAQIEASLERVRSRTLAMQKSDELAETAAILFQQLIQLGIEPNRLYIGIIKDNSSETEFWTTEEDGSKISTAYTTDLLNNPSFTKMYEGWKRKEKSTVVDIQGEELKEYIDYLTSLNIPFKDGKKQTRRIQYLAYFAKGFIGMASPDEQPRESMEILERFAYAFNLTFTRFNDLKVAEAQARQAQIEVALERVRARALAMQEPEELKEVAKVLRQEMGTLGVEELETSSIYIHDPGSDLSECWYAIKDIRKGKTKLVSDHFALNLSATWVGSQMLDLFESSETKSSIVMTGKNRLEWIRYCEENSKPLQGYYGEDIPDRTYHLYKFSHGAIGAASAGEISTESWDLLKRAATAFSLAYSRFKDLTQARIDLLKLKEEKQRAETALTELKAAQSQLVQAEKMASLGELTAGIAHEIQNPLNFVNNFSEVSAELIDEAQGEIEKGDLEEIKFILQDLKDNLTKINHHGKRAGSIVKGMLEHSRKSEGKKELTDLNQLADECLRLSFHGLRAKDKTFQADFKTDFDSELPKLEVVSQDIGRVLLNLINNAFYAANERLLHAPPNSGFKPEVIVSSKLTTSGVEISVKDNGTGIPDSNKEKIFQPFFTTKPTGSGTGLGLSLSYDIVKAHGGELKVQSEEEKGTKFTVNLKN